MIRLSDVFGEKIQSFAERIATTARALALTAVPWLNLLVDSFPRASWNGETTRERDTSPIKQSGLLARLPADQPEIH